MDSREKKDKGIAIVGTIVVHALAVLVLLLMAFKTPLPLPGEEGVEVDLGMMDQGMGYIQPETPAIPMAAQPQQEESKNEEDIVTQTDEERHLQGQQQPTGGWLGRHYRTTWRPRQAQRIGRHQEIRRQWR